MQYSVIVLFVYIYAVNASVININLFNDEGPEVSNSVEDCNFQACDQLCRNIGFPGGACVGDRCDCDNFKHLTNILKSFRSLSDCSPLDCDQSCRRIGFHGGACVNGHCKCDILSDRRGHLTRNVSGCDIITCDEMCHRMNFAGGTCSDGSCMCY